MGKIRKDILHLWIPCITAVATQKDHGPELQTPVSVCESTPDDVENYNKSSFQTDKIHRRYYKRMSFSVW